MKLGITTPNGNTRNNDKSGHPSTSVTAGGSQFTGITVNIQKDAGKDKDQGLDLTDVDYTAQSLVQFIPKFEEHNIQEVRVFDQKAFTTFDEEACQDINKSIAEMKTKHI